MSETIKTNDNGAPERIWLQLNGEENPDDYDDPYVDCSMDISWCWEKIYDHDVMYIRADNLQDEVKLAIQLLEVENNTMRNTLEKLKQEGEGLLKAVGEMRTQIEDSIEELEEPNSGGQKE